jgi:hypothetical protein
MRLFQYRNESKISKDELAYIYVDFILALTIWEMTTYFITKKILLLPQ